MTTIHDVFRFLVRSSRVSDEETQRRLLLAVDANEAGFQSAEDWQEELDKRAAAARRVADPNAPETPEEKAARLEARNAQLEALIAAQSGAQTARPATPLGNP